MNTLTYLDIKATASRWAAEYDLYEDDIWTHPYSNIEMSITQVLWSLYTERYMRLEGMKMHFDRYGRTIEAKRQFEAEQACCAHDNAVMDATTMPLDMVMYWREVYGGDRINPPEAAPIWEFCDEADAPVHMSLTDADGLVLLDV